MPIATYEGDRSGGIGRIANFDTDPAIVTLIFGRFIGNLNPLRETKP
jgi:hypothetical protein